MTEIKINRNAKTGSTTAVRKYPNGSSLMAIVTEGQPDQASYTDEYGNINDHPIIAEIKPAQDLIKIARSWAVKRHSL